MFDPSVVVLAHPLTQQAELPASPLVLALLAVYLLAMVAALAIRRRKAPASDHGPPPSEAEPWSPDRDDLRTTPLSRTLFWVARGLGLAGFALALVAARLGNPDQLVNITPVLTIGAGWPLVTLASFLIGRVWWWINPFDTVARPVSVLGAGEGSATAADGTWAPVWWAVAPAALWMLYLTAWPSGLAPRSIGWTLIAYTLVTLAGCLAVGRRTWLWRGEFFTVFFDMLSALRVQGIRWTPPAGAPALLGVVAGGALFGLFRISDLGGLVAYGPRTDPYAWLVGIVVMAVSGFAAERAARRIGRAVAVVGLIPMAGALALALALARSRLTTSLQLLPILASDPLGRGANMFGTAGNSINPVPWGEVGPVWVQVALLLGGAVIGLVLALTAARGRPTNQRSTPVVPRRAAGVVLTLLGTYLGIGVAAAAAI